MFLNHYKSASLISSFLFITTLLVESFIKIFDVLFYIIFPKVCSCCGDNLPFNYKENILKKETLFKNSMQR